MKQIIYNYKIDKSRFDKLASNARKFNLEDFTYEYISLYDVIALTEDKYIANKINKGDKITLVTGVYNKDGSKDYSRYAFYKNVISTKNYRDDIWSFILDNVEELKPEARKLYNSNKNNSKRKFVKNVKTIIGYHVSPNKFKTFKYGVYSQSLQFGSNSGFFFFKDIKHMNIYLNSIKEQYGFAYIYKCKIKVDNHIIVKGEDIGVGVGRLSELIHLENEGYDSVTIKNADTGYGITDEIVVFDDDNIQIEKITLV